jgi:glycosyltransferase involved in cell wall biosynthesis
VVLIVHIVLIPSWYPSSSEPLNGIFIKDQAEALATDGIKVTVLHVRVKTSCFSNSGLRVRMQRRCNLREFVVHLGVPVRGSLWLARFEKLLMLIAGLFLVLCRTDIVHAHTVFRAGIQAEVLANWFHLPFIVTEHNTAYARRLYSPAKLIAARRILDAASGVLAVSPYLAAQIASSTGYPEAFINVIPNMVDTDFFEVYPSTMKKQYPDDPWRLCIICILSSKKRVDIALKAMQILLEGGLAIELMVIGNGPEKAFLLTLADKLGISTHVHFLGMLPKEAVKEVLCTSHVLVSSSDYETFGLTIAEAHACGIPTVVTDSGGPASFVDTSNGMIVPKADPGAMAQAIKVILSDFDRYDPLIIRETCVRKFGRAAVLQSLRQVYDSIVATRRHF